MTGKSDGDSRGIMECFKNGLGVIIIVSLDNRKDLTTRSAALF